MYINLCMLFYTPFKPKDDPCGPKHVAEYTMELGYVDCVLDYLHCKR